MNLKQAKRARQVARELTELTGAPWRRLTAVKVPPGRTGRKLGAEFSVVVLLDPSCGRDIYQRLKGRPRYWQSRLNQFRLRQGA